MIVQTRCAFIIPRKGRSCRMLVKKGQKYCGEHANQEGANEDRIPCPNDPKHTVDCRLLEQHLMRCNSRVREEQWIVKDMNAVKGETKFADKIDRRATLEEVSEVSQKLLNCYESISREIITAQLHATEVENHLAKNPELSENKRKHLIQQSSIIGHLVSAKLLQNDPSVCVFELGAGKAQLAYWMTKRAPRAKFLLIDRSGSRNKYDNRALLEDPELDISRLRCSVEHLDLSKVKMLREVRSLCAVCKHFCGSATDAGIRCLVNGISGGLSLDGFVLVPCCHHKSRYSEYCGREFLAQWNMDSEGDFVALRHVATWAVSGVASKSDKSSLDEGLSKHPINCEMGTEDTSIDANVANVKEQSCSRQNDADGVDISLPWCASWKEEMGRRAKVVLEIGRARYFSKLGFATRVLKYVPESISPENLLILGIKQKS